MDYNHINNMMEKWAQNMENNTQTTIKSWQYTQEVSKVLT